MKVVVGSARARRTGVVVITLAGAATVLAILAVTARPASAAPSVQATVQATSASPSPAPLAWSGPVPIEKPPYATGRDLAAISCASARFCLTEQQPGLQVNVLTSDDPAGGPSAWSAPSLAIGGFTAVAGPGYLSCPAASFCAQLTEAGGIFISTAPARGQAWTQTYGPPPYPLYGLSCPSARLCVAVGGGGEIITSTDPGARDATWHVARNRRVGWIITAVSCPTASFCAAVNVHGEVLTSTDPAGGIAAWSVADVDGTATLRSVSCPSAAFCLAQTRAGELAYSADPDGGATAWHLTTDPYGSDLTQLSCASAAFCLGLDGGNLASSIDPAAGPSAWSELSLAQYQPAALSCPTASFCTVSGATGYVLTSSDPASPSATWTAADIDGYTRITDVDCPSVRLCLTTDSLGNLFTSGNPAGGPAAWHEPGFSVSSVSCPTATFCAAISGASLLTSDDPAGGASGWQPTSLPAATGLQLSCPSSSSCVAVGSSGGSLVVLTSTDPAGGAAAWQEADLGTGFAAASALTCPSTGLCVAISGNQILSSADPAGGAAAWTVAPFSQFASLASLSCPSSRLCLAIGNQASSLGPPFLGRPYVLNSTDPDGGAAAWNVNPDPAGRLVDCPSTAECYLFNPGIDASVNPAARQPAWSASTSTAEIVSVSCPAVSLCVGGYPSTYSGGIELATPPRPGASRVALRLSATRIRYRHESSERLFATVGPRYPQYAAVPAGRVVIVTGKHTLCRLTLRGGRAACQLTSSELGPGLHWLRVRYLGSRQYAAAPSAAVRLNVTR